mmetsp:Transcript_13336/g.25541  ORF Transcript_13336/g.25541 Transcript_13336/m.25541 type:complete len:87 (+) Transcript_13336:637-897(+)
MRRDGFRGATLSVFEPKLRSDCLNDAKEAIIVGRCEFDEKVGWDLVRFNVGRFVELHAWVGAGLREVRRFPFLGDTLSSPNKLRYP